MDTSEHAGAAVRLPRAQNVPAKSQITVLHLVEPHNDRVLYVLTTVAPKFREATLVLIPMTKQRGRFVWGVLGGNELPQPGHHVWKTGAPACHNDSTVAVRIKVFH